MVLGHYWTQFLIIWVLGLINNLAYVVVLASCKSLAESFDAADMISVLQWSNVALGLGTKVINMVYLTNVPYTIRMTITAVLLGGGIAITAISTRVSFVLAVIGVLFMGSGCALGESVLIGGYFKLYDPQLTGAWSSGTGGAGVAGTVLFILFHSVLELDHFTIFLLLLPTTLIYYVCFWILHLRYGPGSAYRNSLAEKSPDGIDASLLLADTLAQLDAPRGNTPLSDAVAEPLPGLGYLSFGERPQPLLAEPAWGPDTLLADSNHNSPYIHSRQLSYRAPALPFGASESGSASSAFSSLPPPLVHTASEAEGMPSRDSVLSHEGGLLGTNARLPQTPTSLARAMHSAPIWSQDDLSAAPLALDADADASVGVEPEQEDVVLLLGSSPQDAVLDSTSPFTINAVDTKATSTPHHSRSSASNKVVPTGDTAEETQEEGSLVRAVELMGGLALQLGAVYFLEYVVCVGFASLANPHSKDEGASWLSRNSYEMLSACYQLGVLISRSSIGLIVIDRVQFLTFGQFANWVFWFAQVWFYYIPLDLLFPLMVIVGIFAGLAYVNMFYKVMRDPRLGPHKEKALNLLSLSANIGTMMSSVFTLVASKTFFKHKYD